MKVPTAALVVIGNEILTGKIADANTPYLARRLYELGVDLKRVEVVPDDVDEIARAVRSASEGFDFVLTSGGVGPTHDDVTMAGVAQAFGGTVVRHSYLENLLSHHYEGEELTAARARFAEIPDGAQLLIRNPGEFPQIVVQNVYIFPGVPEVLRKKFEAVADLFHGVPFRLRRVRLEGDETDVAPVLNRAVRLHPQVRFGSYPYREPEAQPEWRILLTLEAREPEAVDKAAEFLLGALPPAMNPVLEPA